MWDWQQASHEAEIVVEFVDTANRSVEWVVEATSRMRAEIEGRVWDHRTISAILSALVAALYDLAAALNRTNDLRRWGPPRD